MNWLVVAVAILGGAVYLALCLALILFVSVPATLVLGAVAAVLGAVGTWVLVAGSLARPAQDRDLPVERAVPRHVLEPGPGVEPAWRHYLAAQGRMDAVTATDAVLETARRLWRRMDSTTRHVVGLGWPVLWPLAPVPYAVAVAAGAGAAVAWLLAAVVLGVPAGLWWSVRAAAVRVHRLVARARLRRARAAATCTASGCDETTTLPVVECRCGRRHHQLFPGGFGVFRRRCTCGALLPTTAGAAAGSHVLRCPRCDRTLLPGQLRGADVRIAVVGGPGAGSTRFVDAGLAALTAAVRAAGGQATALTPEAAPAEPVRRCTSVRMAAGRQQGTVHVYDASGTAYTDPAHRRRLYHLPHVQGLALVIDPNVLPRLAGRSDASSDEEGVDPELCYRLVVQHLREQRVPTGERALAVVVTRTDQLEEHFCGRGPRAGSAGVRDWLVSMGLDNLVVAAERDFGAVRYFAVEAPGAVSSTAGDVLRWLARRAGLRLPPLRPGPAEAAA